MLMSNCWVRTGKSSITLRLVRSQWTHESVSICPTQIRMCSKIVIQIRPHNRRLLLRNPHNRRALLPPISNRHGRPRRIPLPLGQLQPLLRRLSTSLRSHQPLLSRHADSIHGNDRHRDRVPDRGEFESVERGWGCIGRGGEETSQADAGQDRGGEQMRSQRRKETQCAAWVGLGAKTWMRLHGNVGAGNGEYRGDFCLYACPPFSSLPSKAKPPPPLSFPTKLYSQQKGELYSQQKGEALNTQPQLTRRVIADLVIVRRVIESRRQSHLHPFNPNPLTTTLNPYSPNTSNRTSIMNLTKENALKAAAGGGGVRLSPLAGDGHSATMVAVARTPALARPTGRGEEEKQAGGRVKGESTRLDGRPNRRKSILGRGVGSLARFRCWGGGRGRRR